MKPWFLAAAVAVTAILAQAEPMPPTENSARATAILGGGCFWCVEAVYQEVPGVESVVSGYAGGSKLNPTYQEISRGNTGHAEVVRITFDPAKISYEKVIDLFWKAHDPTTLNRQGADTGTQYRSIILTQSEEEREAAERSRDAAKAGFKDPIVTEIKPLEVFYPAEEYHQDFYERNPNHPYNRAVTVPKLEKFRKAQDKP